MPPAGAPKNRTGTPRRRTPRHSGAALRDARMPGLTFDSNRALA